MVTEVLGAIVLIDDGLQRIAIDLELVRTFVEAMPRATPLVRLCPEGSGSGHRGK